MHILEDRSTEALRIADLLGLGNGVTDRISLAEQVAHGLPAPDKFTTASVRRDSFAFCQRRPTGACAAKESH